MTTRDPAAALAEAVANGLGKRPRVLPPELLYDDLGSALFEAICHLPWYRITRSETQLLDENAPSIAAALRDPALLVELGPGSGEKLLRIVAAVGAREPRLHVHLVDVSSEALTLAVRTLARPGTADISVEGATWETAIQALPGLRRSYKTALVALLGSNIGNLDGRQARAFLTQIRGALRAGDFFLLGADLVKPVSDLLLAYDDPLGLTSAFNKNLLVRMNRELGANFNLGAFEHRAVWNEPCARVEMYLVARSPQSVTIPGAGLTVSFEAGESIWTESSCKYDRDEVVDMGRAAGFDVAHQWVDEEAQFALTLFAAM